MAEIEGLDDLAGGVEGLERSLTGATGQAAALTGELRDMGGGMAEVVRDLGRLEAGFSGGCGARSTGW